MVYYDEIASGYDLLHKTEQLKKLEIIKDNLALSKNDFLLDVGCGTAFASQIFDCNYIGLDLSFGMLKASQKKGKILQSQAENLPFKDNIFDAVICITALHNFSNPQEALLEMKRVGKGKFAFSILKKSSKFGMIEKSIRKMLKVSEIIEEDKDTIFICPGN